MTRKILIKMAGCVAMLAMLIIALPAEAAVVEVSGGDYTDDTFISGAAGELDTNFGSSEDIIVGDVVVVFNSGEPTEYSITESRYGLLKWDLSGVAALAGANQKIHVNSADVTLTYTGTGDPAAVIGLYYITVANADWVSGSGNGGDALLHEEPSWRYKLDELSPWASFQGGLTGVGIDYLYDPNDDPNGPEINCIDNLETGVDFSETVAISSAKVAEWINDSTSNGGLLLKQKGNADWAVTFISSDNFGSLLPKLTIDYAIVPLECGDAGTGTLLSDFSGPGGEPDCKVDKYDLAAFTLDWLKCSNPNDADCEQ